MKNYDIFWFIIDSVRSFRTGLDDRDWLDVMDDFSKGSISFLNAYTSAPSSRLAAGAMFSGLPSVYISRHFNDWKFSDGDINSISTLKQDYQYNSFPLIDTRNGRENYQYFLPPFSKEFLPKGYHLSDYVWRNSDVTAIFEHILTRKEYTGPACYVCWWDCRRDPRISAHVSKALDLVKELGYFENAIIIMNSDHGYPDPSTSLDATFFENCGHDMVLTEDNIKTPLLIRYPGSPTNKQIKNIVGHIDIIPTIFDILDIPVKEPCGCFHGRSLLPIINGDELEDERIIRSDTRLTMDIGRITSFRSRPYKYIYYYDDNLEALYDLDRDPRELNDLTKQKDSDYATTLKAFRKVKERYEADLAKSHRKQLKYNAARHFSVLQKRLKNRKISIVVVSKAPSELVSILCEILQDLFDCEISQVHLKSNPPKENVESINAYCVDEFSLESFSSIGFEKKELVLYLTENSQRVFLKKRIIEAVKSIPAENYKLLNFNFEVFNYFVSKWFLPNSVKLYLNLNAKAFFYKEEPIYFVKDMIYFVRIVFGVLLGKRVKRDVVAAKEIMESRNYHLTNNRLGYNAMRKSDLEKEYEKLLTHEGS